LQGYARRGRKVVGSIPFTRSNINYHVDIQLLMKLIYSQISQNENKSENNDR